MHYRTRNLRYFDRATSLSRTAQARADQPEESIAISLPTSREEDRRRRVANNLTNRSRSHWPATRAPLRTLPTRPAGEGIGAFVASDLGEALVFADDATPEHLQQRARDFGEGER